MSRPREPGSLSPQLAARLGPQSNTLGASDRGSDANRSGNALNKAPSGRAQGGSDYSRLRGIIRAQKEQMQAMEQEVTHFQSRLHRVEEGHKLELARLKKEVEYHKRLRQGADQRSFELEARLLKQQQAASSGGQGGAGGADEEKDSLIQQSQLLVQKNSELTYKLKTMEGQVGQLEELKAALESELDQAYCERDVLADELEKILAQQHHHHYHRPTEEGEDAAEDAGTGTDGDLGGLPSNDEQPVDPEPSAES